MSVESRTFPVRLVLTDVDERQAGAVGVTVDVYVGDNKEPVTLTLARGAPQGRTIEIALP